MSLLKTSCVVKYIKHKYALHSFNFNSLEVGGDGDAWWWSMSTMKCMVLTLRCMVVIYINDEMYSSGQYQC